MFIRPRSDHIYMLCTLIYWSAFSIFCGSWIVITNLFSIVSNFDLTKFRNKLCILSLFLVCSLHGLILVLHWHEIVMLPWLWPWYICQLNYQSVLMFIKYWELYTTSSNENCYIRKMYLQRVHVSAGECFPVAWLITCKFIFWH